VEHLIVAVSRVSHPHNLKDVVEVAESVEAEVVLLCGDVSINEGFLNELSHGKVLMISGDDDDVHVIKVARKHNVLIDGKIVEVSGVRIGGVGAISTSLDSTSLTLAGEYVDILLTHYPPYGCLDRVLPLFIASGLKAVRSVVDSLKPRLIIIGHATKPTISTCGTAIAIGTSSTVVVIDSLRPSKVRFIPLAREHS
jgi:Icc-related predicted phosphoesterase